VPADGLPASVDPAGRAVVLNPALGRVTGDRSPSAASPVLADGTASPGDRSPSAAGPGPGRI